MLKKSSLSYDYCKKCISAGPNWNMKGTNIGSIQSKNRRNQSDFKGILAFGI